MPTGGSRAALRLHCLRFDVFEGSSPQGGARFYTGALFPVLMLALVITALERQGPAETASACFLVTGLFCFPGLLSDVGAALLDPRDAGFLRTVPVEELTYFRARVEALLLPVVLRTLAFGLVPALAMSFGPAGVWYSAPGYLFATLWLMITLAQAGVLVFALLRRLIDPGRLRDLLVWLQVVLFLLSTATWLWFYSGDGIGEARTFLARLRSPWLPTSWFADLFLFLRGQVEAWPAATLAALLPLLLALLLGRWGRRYVQVLEAVARPGRPAAPPRPSLLRRGFERLFVAREEGASFRLGVALIRRERIFRLQVYPLLAYPLLFLAFGRDRDDGGLFALLFSHLATLILPVCVFFLRFTDHDRAGWLLEYHGPHRAAVWGGARKALVYAVVLPLHLGVSTLLVLDQGWAAGLAGGAVAFSLAVLVVVIGRIPDDLPFSSRFTGSLLREEATGKLWLLFFVIVVVGTVQFQLGQTHPGLVSGLAAVAVLGAATALARRPRLVAGPEPSELGTRAPAPELDSKDAESAPFAVRLRREIKALLVFHVAAAVLALLITVAV